MRGQNKMLTIGACSGLISVLDDWHAEPLIVVEGLFDWLDALPGQPVFVGYPAAFDFMFVYWYLIRFTGRSPFSFAALDIKTMAMLQLGKEYRRTTKKSMPKRWFDDLPHNHQALDDAIEQGALFCNVEGGASVE